MPLPAALPADFLLDDWPIFGIRQLHHGRPTSFIAQSQLASLLNERYSISPATVTRALQQVDSQGTSACQLDATPAQLQHLKARGCIGASSSRAQLLSINTVLLVVQRLRNVPARLQQELRQLLPVMPAEPPAPGAAADAAAAVGMAPAAAQPSAAAFAGPGEVPDSARSAAAIPAALPTTIPNPSLTEEELHILR